MNIQQTITIQVLRIEAITNSSVLQIGTAGIIKPMSSLSNTGGFTGPAPLTGQGLPPFGPVPPGLPQAAAPAQYPSLVPPVIPLPPPKTDVT